MTAEDMYNKINWLNKGKHTRLDMIAFAEEYHRQKRIKEIASKLKSK